MNHMNLVAAFAAAASLFVMPAPAQAQSEAAIKQKIIKASIASYPGNCPCPYNSARNGSSCGRRSAWSRGGGYSPKCYAEDVSAAEVKAYRARH